MKPRPPRQPEASPLKHERPLWAVMLVLIAALMAAAAMAEPLDPQSDLSGLQPGVQAWAVTLAALVLILLQGTFKAAEVAIDLLRPGHQKMLKEANPRAGKVSQHLLDHKARYLAASTVGVALMRGLVVFSSLLLGFSVARYGATRLGWPETFGTLALSALVVALVLGLVALILGELVPKAYASLHPARVSVATYRFVSIAAVVLAPITALVVAVGATVAHRFGAGSTFTLSNQAFEEIKTIVETAEESGEIESDEREMLHSVFEFKDTIAREVMTPRVDLDAMPVNSAPGDIVRLIHDSGHSRIPLYEDTDDQIVGIVHAKDLLRAMVENESPELRKLMRPAIFVPENKSLHELLTELRTSRSQMAVVQDEFGGTAGIVTIEDIVEELVGDIVDEYDVEEPDVVETETGYLVDGKARLDDINEEIGSEFESDEFDTVGGFVFGLFGRQPKVGETIEERGHLFIVAETDGRRIQKLKVERLPESDHDEDED